jgi:acyl-CoA dehydrogenase
VSGAVSRWDLWQWPFFDDSHFELADRLMQWLESWSHDPDDVSHATCRRIVKELGEADFVRYAVPESIDNLDVRSLCVIREALTYHHAIYDALFTMQGIGTLALQQHGTSEQKQRYLVPCRRGDAVAAFALTEPMGGSDVASTATAARLDGDAYILDGDKTLISNAGFADHYIVIARTGEGEGSKGLSAFIVDADTPGLEVGPPIEFIAEHPAASVRFTECRVPASQLIGERGQGFKVAMGAFDLFRPSVGAAAVGLARRAMDELLPHVRTRQLFGHPMGNLQAVGMKLADNAADIDGAALMVYRAAWLQDVRGERGSYAGSMAKLVATEAAGRVVDQCVQLFGGKGVTRGHTIERLYREARPMRIYEGTSEIQKLIIGRNLMNGKAAR